MVSGIEIIKDDMYLACLRLALKSGNDKRQEQKYGAVLVKDGEVIGSGFNRAVVHPKFKLNRPIVQGYVNHAEIEALCNALDQNKVVAGSELFVAGIFFASQTLFFQERYTCLRCIPYLDRHKIASISIPTPDGWKSRKLIDAYVDAKAFSGSAYKKRLESNIGSHSVSLVERLL